MEEARSASTSAPRGKTARPPRLRFVEITLNGSAKSSKTWSAKRWDNTPPVLANRIGQTALKRVYCPIWRCRSSSSRLITG